MKTQKFLLIKEFVYKGNGDRISLSKILKIELLFSTLPLSCQVFILNASNKKSDHDKVRKLSQRKFLYPFRVLSENLSIHAFQDLSWGVFILNASNKKSDHDKVRKLSQRRFLYPFRTLSGSLFIHAFQDLSWGIIAAKMLKFMILIKIFVFFQKAISI